MIIKSTSTGGEHSSVINIALQDIGRNTPPFITINDDEDDDDNNYINDDIIQDFKINNYALYFPNSKIESIHNKKNTEYPTLESFYIDFDETELLLNETIGNESNSALNISEIQSLSQIEIINKLKFFIKRSSSIQINLVSDLDAKLFISCIETDLKNLVLYMETQISQSNVLLESTFESEDIILLINECDLILYQALIHQLFPKIFTLFPSEYICKIRIFTRQLEKIVLTGCLNFPNKFKYNKVIFNLIKYYIDCKCKSIWSYYKTLYLFKSFI